MQPWWLEPYIPQAHWPMEPRETGTKLNKDTPNPIRAQLKQMTEHCVRVLGTQKALLGFCNECGRMAAHWFCFEGRHRSKCKETE